MNSKKQIRISFNCGPVALSMNMIFNHMTVYRGTFLSLVIFIAACTTPKHETESLDFHARAETQTEGGVQVSAAVLSPQETLNTFSLPLAEEGIQPVWIKIRNQENSTYSLMLLSIDPNYFSPSEVAWKFQPGYFNVEDDHENTYQHADLDELIDFFLSKHVPVVVPPHSSASGFVYTHLDPGAKAFAVDLVSDRKTRVFDFTQLVPGFDADFMSVKFDSLYRPDEIRHLDLSTLRKYVENLPCCVLGGDRKTPGDPINLVIVGEGKKLLALLVRRGWDLTEVVHSGTVLRTVASSLFGKKYRTSPVSPLYLFGRSQDIALQKSRNTVDERNHLRLWKAPVSLDGQEVWVGQISRDIGVKFSSKTFVTHKIDPIVDEARLYITMDLAASQELSAYGYAKGVGITNHAAPRYNYTGDPYFTDGLRVVMLLAKGRHSLDKVKFLGWEEPGYLGLK